MKNDDRFYTAGPHADQAECLTHTSAEEAIEHYLDDVFLNREAWPTELKVCVWRRVEVDIESYVKHFGPLGPLLEALDEAYGGEDASHPTEAMKEAEKAFLRTVLAEYVPWPCALEGAWTTQKIPPRPRS